MLEARPPVLRIPDILPYDAGMRDGQLDLFASSGVRHDAPSPDGRSRDAATPAADLTDAALIAAIPDADLTTCQALAAEAARRSLLPAVPALEALCRLFRGFGQERAVPEQAASLQALAAIGGPDAVAAVRRIIAGEVVAAPGLRDAVRAASVLRCNLPEPIAAPLLLHADPDIRALACRCAPPAVRIGDVLCSLLEDLHQPVVTQAAKALGRRGRAEARPRLVRLLRQAPDAGLIEAVTPVADAECEVLLGRIARRYPALRDAAMVALEAIETPRAASIRAGLARADAASPAAALPMPAADPGPSPAPPWPLGQESHCTPRMPGGR